jgi:hypothetical protein
MLCVSVVWVIDSFATKVFGYMKFIKTCDGYIMCRLEFRDSNSMHNIKCFC